MFRHGKTGRRPVSRASTTTQLVGRRRSLANESSQCRYAALTARFRAFSGFHGNNGWSRLGSNKSPEALSDKAFKTSQLPYRYELGYNPQFSGFCKNILCQRSNIPSNESADRAAQHASPRMNHPTRLVDCQLSYRTAIATASPTAFMRRSSSGRMSPFGGGITTLKFGKTRRRSHREPSELVSRQ
jgi:hypothetical protein